MRDDRKELLDLFSSALDEDDVARVRPDAISALESPSRFRASALDAAPQPSSIFLVSIVVALVLVVVGLVVYIVAWRPMPPSPPRPPSPRDEDDVEVESITARFPPPQRQAPTVPPRALSDTTVTSDDADPMFQPLQE